MTTRCTCCGTPLTLAERSRLPLHVTEKEHVMLLGDKPMPPRWNCDRCRAILSRSPRCNVCHRHFTHGGEPMVVRLTDGRIVFGPSICEECQNKGLLPRPGEQSQ